MQFLKSKKRPVLLVCHKISDEISVLYKKVGFLFAPHKNKRKEKEIGENFKSKIMSLVFVTDYKNSSMIYIFLHIPRIYHHYIEIVF